MAFVFQAWCTWPVSASTTRATWRRWCCWWWRTNWAGLKCAALDNKIKLHQFSQWLQIDDEEDMFATNPEEMPKRWRTKFFFFFKIQFVDNYNYLLVHTLQYYIPALQNFLTLCWRNRRTRQALKSSSSSDHPPITGIYSYFPIGKVAIFADPSHMVAHCAPVRMG